MNQMNQEEDKQCEEDVALEDVQDTEEEKHSSDIKDNASVYQEEIAELKDQLLRSMAEIENLRIRHDKQLTETREYAITNFAKDLVTVLDNFTMALIHIPEDLPTEMRSIIDGIEMTHKELLSIFHKQGIEVISPKKGDEFNYHEHHAISEAQTDDLKPGQIISTMQMGYKMKNRLLRPAAVVIAKK